MSTPQATHSPWQSLRPGVKRHASSTTRYHRGIFIAQHSQTEEGKAVRGVDSEMRVTSRRNRGAGEGSSYRDQGAAYKVKADSGAYCVSTNSLGSLAGFGRSVKALVSGTSSANGRREMTCKWDGEKAQLEERKEKNGPMSVGKKPLQQNGWEDD